MPDVWTHILFSEEVLSELKGTESRWARAHKTLFRFGSQGPDFFFYYRFWPWEKTQGIDDIGRDIQNVIGGQFVRTAIRYVKTLQPQGFTPKPNRSFPQPVDNSGDNPVETQQYQTMLVYLLGFITHYALDSIAHPYVHYKCGIYKRNDSATARYYGNHKTLEAIIDTIFLAEKRGLSAARERVNPQLDLGGSLPESLVWFYQHQVREFFHRELPAAELNKAYQDMLKALALFHDPEQKKVRLLRIIRALSAGKLNYLHFFYPHTVNNSVDYLNRGNKCWLHPADPDEVHYESFDKLWEQAKDRAKAWIGAALQYVHGDISAVQLDEHIPNLSFSSGKTPAKGGEKVMQHFAPIFDLK